jgi:catechol 2,3-dioxygenase-like lactoylglutathione lyase family enzyme
MTQEREDGSGWTFHHLGVVVKDLDKAIEYFESLGLGPFSPNPSESVTDRKVYGKPANIKLKGAAAKLGPLEVELLQPVEGRSIQSDYLDKKGEGINHIGFVVHDLQKAIRKLEEKGFSVVSSGTLPDSGGFAYFNTDQVGGMMIELIQYPSR